MEPSAPSRPVLVVDFGAQYAQLIARRVREAKIFSEVVSHRRSVEELLSRRPGAIILSGGPSSVYAPGAPILDRRLFEAGVPVLGICYGFQAMAVALGGTVDRTDKREFGRTKATVEQGSVLFTDQPEKRWVWMSHGDAVSRVPEGFRVTGSTDVTPIAAFEDPAAGLCGMQWHPEVAHTEFGQQAIERFLYDVAHLEPNWTTHNIIESEVAQIRAQVGTRHVICGLSGGVDSAVAAALVHEAVGDQLTCVFVDHGLLRKGERRQVIEDFRAATKVKLHVVNAQKRFLKALKGKVDPEAKRKAIGRQFIEEFDAATDKVIKEHGHKDDIEILVQGTLYPDVVESGGGEGAANIKSHHNVGGLPKRHKFEIIEPLKLLFKDEVRAVGLELGLPEQIVWRQPFPGPGLAIRILGKVTAKRLAIVREADAIAREELTAAGLDRDIWQCPVVLLADVRSVGVQGDQRSYQHPIVLRPVSSDDAMTADWFRVPYDVLERISTRITNEVAAVNRVVLDVTSKPPGTIEWE